MPAHTRRAIDPTPPQLAALLGEVFRRAARDTLAGGFDPRDGPPAYDDSPPPWTELLGLAAELPMGVYARRHRVDWRTPHVRFGACWWNDVLGRRHWVAQADDGSEDYTIGSLADEFDQGEGLVEGVHPLGWIAPELASGQRHRGGVTETVVMCRCGYAGTPESLAWTGSLCGPCFDRESEGIPPAGMLPLRPDVGLLSSFELMPNGRLVGAHVAQANPELGVHHLHLRVWDAPWTGKPRWGREWGEAHRYAVSPAGLIAVETAPGRVTLVGLDDGKTRDSRDLAVSGELRHLAFAGNDGERLVGNFQSYGLAARGFLRAWTVTPGSLGPPLYLREHSRLTFPFAVSPRGQRLLLSGDRVIEVLDAETAEVRERLTVPAGGRVSAMLTLADGAVVAATHMDDRHPPALHRWRPRGEPAARGGLLSWMMTPSGRGPEVTRPMNGVCEKLVASPDGRLIASTEDGLVLRDAATLEDRGRFRPARGELYPSVAFTGDGQAVVLSDRGLAVWPWKELFGIK